eukprot:TRINITY_DN11232_c0_g1_i1.p1 TRINITY_DN11232_c0_g1~~TRINITY_DN11232_c0_g1_i1.p1  ORF type:complete len:448 (-),score=80.96 TRINITY_DN11232_c0_g1_i1:34-1377(-)
MESSHHSTKKAKNNYRKHDTISFARLKTPMMPYNILNLDINYKTMLYAYYRTFVPLPRKQLNESIEQLFGERDDQIFAGLSVRSIFDLWLKAKGYKKGSEIVVTAINIPDMKLVVEDNGLVLVPCDVMLETLGPDMISLENAITDKTVAILVAHVYGRRNHLDAVAEIADKYNLDIIDDRAESYNGPNDSGDRNSAITLFSFGSIKKNTSFGGGIGVVKEPEIYSKMKELENLWNIRPMNDFRVKILKYTFAMLIMNNPIITYFVHKILAVFGYEHKTLFVAILPSFPNNLFTHLRQRPDAGLLALLEYNIRNFDMNEFKKAEKHSSVMTNIIADDRIYSDNIKYTIPGLNASHVDYWLFPIIVTDPEEVMEKLEKYGIDSYKESTQLSCLDHSNGDSNTPMARFIMDKIIYIPVHKVVPIREIKKMGAIVKRVLEETEGHLQFPKL